MKAKNTRLVYFGTPTYNQDGLATRNNCDFMKDKLFMQSYKLGKETGSWGDENIHWRAYVVCWAADKVKKLEGDFVECGVNKGGFARTIINYIDFKNLNKDYYLLDTFCGLDEKYIAEEEKRCGIKSGGYEECYDAVKKTFSNFNNVKIIRGTVPDTLSQVETKKVSFLSIDMNNYTPEIKACEFFWDKLVSGGIIILDDYGFSEFELQKKAFDSFALRKGIQILSLPTGQGLIFKP